MHTDTFVPFLPDLALILSVFLVGVASPGPATLMIVNVAAGQGRKPAAVLAAGIVLGSLFWGSVAALGFVAALKSSAAFFTVMKTAGGIYLLFLAFKALRSAWKGGQVDSGAMLQARTPLYVQFSRGVLLHITNPKAPLVWMATLSVGTVQDAPPAFLLLAVSACSVAAILVFLGYALLFSTQRAADFYRAVRRPFDLVMGMLFGAAGLRILMLRAP